MSKVNNKIGGLAQFLSPATVNGAQQEAQVEKDNIVKIDIDKLVPDPFNMYGLRDVDSLAGMIASNGFHVEAIEVRPFEDGKYMIISGHRRRAAWQMLLNDGETQERELPCIIRTFEDAHIQIDNNGITEDKVITAEQQANIALILANRGQRKEKTIEEELWEIQQLEPYVKILFAQLGTPKKRGHYKSFFASILNLKDTSFQRKKNLLRLNPRARLVLADREINLSVASELSGLPSEEQDIVLDKIFSGELENTYAAIVEYKRRLKGDEKEDEELPDETEDEQEDSSDGGEDESDFPDFTNFEDDEEEADSAEEPQESSHEPTSSGSLQSKDGTQEDLEGLERKTGQLRLVEGGASLAGGNTAVSSSEEEVPEPPNTGHPHEDTHKWFLNIFEPEIARLRAIERKCQKLHEHYSESDEEGAAAQAAKWDFCRSYMALKIVSLQDAAKKKD